VWLPQAQRLGLRYVAHIVQANTHSDILTLTLPRQQVVEAIELQLFSDVAAAEEWLRSCQRPPRPFITSGQQDHRSFT
jgi:hypothetical protein